MGMLVEGAVTLYTGLHHYSSQHQRSCAFVLRVDVDSIFLLNVVLLDNLPVGVLLNSYYALRSLLVVFLSLTCVLIIQQIKINQALLWIVKVVQLILSFNWKIAVFGNDIN